MATLYKGLEWWIWSLLSCVLNPMHYPQHPIAANHIWYYIGCNITKSILWVKELWLYGLCVVEGGICVLPLCPPFGSSERCLHYCNRGCIGDSRGLAMNEWWQGKPQRRLLWRAKDVGRCDFGDDDFEVTIGCVFFVGWGPVELFYNVHFLLLKVLQSESWRVWII